MQTNRNKNGRKAQDATPIYAGRQVVGHVKNGVFHKAVTGSKHFLHKPAAIAFDVASLEAAQRAGAVRVEVYDRETKTTYAASIAHIWEHGENMNRGYGEQIFLVMDGWTKHTSGAPSQPLLFGEI